ncbi:tRNA (adenosine(37)-N6)-threonylcarbamoyltransferase complex dimerization subunit type 1 TsaB [Ahrensia sp. R2A130]|uniref:tRNA (adenosine(37)-N6)-threonylcarbamoyltransferase complex dimerization subunit type 1 TsaB n=1 Tax=Ahrensia sp. R2A130 TaxID=744979 RepID=UPI0001E09C8C|nr:tRNA (adenosine(37)-N6)-threonylcarbamoyltransferase complex dimerization subunit type 1 TsaB [Ahrensia sp. R2A130]EFL88385.1 universal bacterial protein YeaZ [Ahrensia sp. R2A130]
MLLAVDTSGPDCTVVLADPATGKIISSASEHLGRGHAERLMTMIGEVLAEVDATYSDLTMIGCTIGPGSFTGLRVGMAAAKGLALAANIPCIGVTVFEGIHAGLPNGPAAVVQDAKRGEVWMQVFGETEAGEPVALPPGHAVAALPQDITHLAGSGAALIIAAAHEMGRTGLQAIEGTVAVTPAGIATACLAVRDRSGPVRPLYLRAPDAKPQAKLVADVALAGVVKANTGVA